MNRICKKALCLLLTAGCLLGILSGCTREKGGDGFGFALSGAPKQIDPQVAFDSASLTVISAVFEGLTRVDETGEPVPGAATWTVSDDGLTYTFTLKTSCWSTVKVKGQETGFEDPVQVTAEDFVFGIRRTADPATGSPYANDLLSIVNAKEVLAGKRPVNDLGVKALDDTTLQIRLSTPDKTFLKKLASPGYMPCNREFFGYTSGRYGLEKQYVLTNGAFAVTGWVEGKSVSLSKNEHYHDAQNVLPARVQYRTTTSQEEDVELLKKGYLDGASVPENLLQTAKELKMQTVPLNDTMRFLWMNNDWTPFSSSDIRRGIRDGVEWNVLLKELGDNCIPGNSFVPPDATAGEGAYQGVLSLTTNPANAKTALEKGLSALSLDSLPRFTILAEEQNANLARYILQSLSKNLGIHGELETVEKDVLLARIKAGNYQMAIGDVTGVGFTAKENLEMFTSSGSGNYARYQNERFDALYQQTGSSEKSIRQLEQVLWEECPVLPLGSCTRYYCLGAEVQGVTVRPFNGGAYGGLLEFTGAYREG